MKENSQGIFVLGIVGIVAVVGMIMLFNGGSSGTVVMTQPEVGRDADNIAGEAIRGLSADRANVPVRIYANAGNYTFNDTLRLKWTRTSQNGPGGVKLRGNYNGTEYYWNVYTPMFNLWDQQMSTSIPFIPPPLNGSHFTIVLYHRPWGYGPSWDGPTVFIS